MPKTQHTPEPWEFTESTVGYSGHTVAITPQGCKFGRVLSIIIGGYVPEVIERYVADFKRIVACVNGCKGIKDPETTIQELIRQLRVAGDRLQDYCTEANGDLNDWQSQEIDALLAKLEAPRLCEDCGSSNHVEGSERCRVSYPEAEGGAK